MRLNNEMMLAVRLKPWWQKYVAASVVAIASAVVMRSIGKNFPSSMKFSTTLFWQDMAGMTGKRMKPFRTIISSLPKLSVLS
ncbi:hypothetical protein ACHAWC_009570 [Mediolabrus comicus]